MPGTSIVPDGQVVLTPLESDLCVVILCHDIEQIPEYQIRFVLCDSVDSLREALVYINRFPASDG